MNLRQSTCANGYFFETEEEAATYTKAVLMVRERGPIKYTFSSMEEEMFYRIKFYFAEVWIRVYCKNVATKLAGSILQNPSDAKSKMGETQSHVASQIIQAYRDSDTYAAKRVAELQQMPGGKAALVEAYKRVMVLTSCPANAHSTAFVELTIARFFDLVLGNTFIRNCSNKACLALWQKYPMVDLNPIQTLMVMTLRETGNIIIRNKLAGSFKSFTEFVESFQFIHKNNRLVLMEYFSKNRV